MKRFYVPIVIVFCLAFVSHCGFVYAVSRDFNDGARERNGSSPDARYDHDRHNPLDALRDPELRKFIRTMLLTNYTEGRLFPALRKDVIDAVLTTLEAGDDPADAARQVNAHVLDFVSSDGRFRQAEKNLPVEYGEIWKRELAFTASFMSGVLYDYGCGDGVDALLSGKVAGVRRVILSDQVDRRTYKVKRISASRDNIDFYLNDGDRVPLRMIGAGTVTCTRLNCIIHHVYPDRQNPYTPENKELIVAWLKDHYAVLHEGGRLLVWEDTYPETSRFAIDRKALGGEQAALNEAFDRLSRIQKYKYLVWNDYYWNVLYSGKYEMQMPYRFYTIEEWLDLFSAAGFTVKEVHYWGFVKNRIHGAASTFFVLEKHTTAT